jgi:hypothetical protein
VYQSREAHLEAKFCLQQGEALRQENFLRSSAICIKNQKSTHLHIQSGVQLRRRRGTPSRKLNFRFRKSNPAYLADVRFVEVHLLRVSRLAVMETWLVGMAPSYWPHSSVFIEFELANSVENCSRCTGAGLSDGRWRCRTRVLIESMEERQPIYRCLSGDAT